MLTADERSDEVLIGEYGKTGDVRLRNILVERYGYIAEIIAKKFSGGVAEAEDLKQVGALAIIKAIDRFDASKNIKLSTYLTHCVSGEIKNYFRDNTDIIKVSRDIKKLKKDIRRYIDALEKAGEKSPSAQQIAAALSVSVERVIEAMEYSREIAPLDTPVGNEEGLALYETIPGGGDDYLKVDNRDFFERALNILNPTERQLIECRFVDQLSQTETAKRLDVSQMLVSRLERKIIAKLRQYA